MGCGAAKVQMPPKVVSPSRKGEGDLTGSAGMSLPLDDPRLLQIRVVDHDMG